MIGAFVIYKLINGKCNVYHCSKPLLLVSATWLVQYFVILHILRGKTEAGIGWILIKSLLESSQ